MTSSIGKLADAIVLKPTMGDPKAGRSGILTLRNEIGRCLDDGKVRIVVDMSEITFANSTDLGAMVGMMRTVMSRKGAMVFSGLELRIAETLALVNMLSILPVRLTRNEAEMAVARISLSGDTWKTLLAGNPRIEQIRQWWDSIIAGKTKDSQIVRKLEEQPKPEKEAEPVESTASTADVASVFESQIILPEKPPESPTGAISTSDKKWLELLQLVRATKEYCTRNGIRFSHDMSLRDLVGLVADKLTDEGGAGE